MSDTNTGGRPSLYSKQVCDLICELLAQGQTLSVICADPAMPSLTTVHRWRNEPSKREFRDAYKAARVIQYDVLAESILDKAKGNPATDTMVKINRDRLEIYAIQWYLGKMAATKYGDKPVEEQANTTGYDVTNLSDEELELHVTLLKKMSGE